MRRNVQILTCFRVTESHESHFQVLQQKNRVLFKQDYLSGAHMQRIWITDYMSSKSVFPKHLRTFMSPLSSKLEY